MAGDSGIIVKREFFPRQNFRRLRSILFPTLGSSISGAYYNIYFASVSLFFNCFFSVSLKPGEVTHVHTACLDENSVILKC